MVGLSSGLVCVRPRVWPLPHRHTFRLMQFLKLLCGAVLGSGNASLRKAGARSPALLDQEGEKQ